MSKSAVKISLDLLSNPLCEQDQEFLNMVTALDTAMKRMDAFNQEKVSRSCCQWPMLAPFPSDLRRYRAYHRSSQTRLFSCPCLL